MRTRRMQLACSQIGLAVTLSLATPADPYATASAQHAVPVGIVVHANSSSKAKVSANAMPADGSGGWEAKSFWTWTTIGVLVGGVAGGVWAGVQIAHSDDSMLANAAITIAVAGGTIIGGLVGTIAYSAWHAPGPASTQ